MLADTIVAIATPPGRGGIGVIRLSGPDALRIARAVVGEGGARALEHPNTAAVVDLVDPRDRTEALDRAVVTAFHAPRSYTGEDVVEISCHGSPVVLDAALEVLLAAGARVATPGEFTLRAFLNGRVDLTQAEAVRDLVDAQTRHQAHRAQRQLRGELSRRLAPLKERLLGLIVHLESTVEFVEDDIEPEGRAALEAELAAAAADLAALTATYRLGRLVAEGISVALVGAPNAGKSSIFNILLRFERAIVTPVPGTTRDLVSERVELGGLPLRLVDTAGLRDTEDVVERIGVERTRTAIADADLVVVVVDAAEAEDGPTRELLDATEGLDRLAVWNKVDLAAPPAWLDELAAERGVSRVRASAATGEGIESLRTAILEAVGGRGGVEQDGILVTNARHHALLQRASGHLTEAARALGAGFSEEIALVGLHGALRDLGELTGETAIDDILNRIFSTFCIGK
jgi:tRNA modification GTPase